VAGTLATLRYVVTVPEVPQTDIVVSSSGYVSDSLQFLDVVAGGGGAPFITSGKCDITVMKFATTGAPRMNIAPMPVREEANVTFRMQETVPVHLDIVDARGAVVKNLLDGSVTLPGGEYNVRVGTAELPSGIYLIRITAGVFTSTSTFIIAK
jgi:hypothetical protein